MERVFTNEKTMKILIRWLLSALVVMLLPYIVPGIDVDTFTTALLVALVLGLVNALLRPLLVILTLPITIFTLGLWLLVINAAMLLLVSRIVSGFVVDGFVAALIGSIVLWLLSWAVQSVFADKKPAVI